MQLVKFALAVLAESVREKMNCVSSASAFFQQDKKVAVVMEELIIVVSVREMMVLPRLYMKLGHGSEGAPERMVFIRVVVSSFKRGFQLLSCCLATREVSGWSGMFVSVCCGSYVL